MTKKIEPKKIEASPNRILRTNTPAREAELQSLRKQLESEKPALKAEGKAKLQAVKAKRAELASIFTSLKAERERLGLSLADMAERSGMAREVIYRLESQTTPNPTIGTIQR